VAEIALSLVLLAGAALLIVSFTNLMKVAPGFQPAELLVTRMTLPAVRYGELAKTVAFFDAVYERLGGVPGIQHVAGTTSLPFDGPDSRLDLTIEHRTEPSSLPVRAHPRIVSAGFFQTMGIPLVRGRVFTEHDGQASPNVAIVNETAARRYWPGEDPIGRRISLGAPDDWREIVGIVGDIRHEGLDADPDPAVFLPQRQPFTLLGAGFPRAITLIVRTSGDAASTASVIRATVAGVDPQVPIGVVRPMDTVIDESIAPRRLNFLLVSAFAGVALCLTAAGLYGVMSYVVAERTREIGVRMALGATPRQVVWMVLGEAAIVTMAGIAIGVAGALALTRSMRSLLFGVSAVDPTVYVVVSLVLAAVALVAAAVPSGRATRVDPLIALRDS